MRFFLRKCWSSAMFKACVFPLDSGFEHRLDEADGALGLIERQMRLISLRDERRTHMVFSSFSIKFLIMSYKYTATCLNCQHLFFVHGVFRFKPQQTACIHCAWRYSLWRSGREKPSTSAQGTQAAPSARATARLSIKSP